MGKKQTRLLQRRSIGDAIFDIINYTLLILLCVVTIYPFLNVIAIAFNDATDAVRGGIYIWPREFSLRNFEVIFTENKNITQALKISALRAVIGSSTSVLSCLMVAYTLSRKDFIFRPLLTKFLVFTMYFNGGLIPTYLLIKSLGLVNNFWVYILPRLISAYNIMIMRSYIEGIPYSLVEAAKIDGASEYRILFTIIMPLSIPVLATITLFTAVGQWNSWFDTMLYASSKPELSTLQFELQKLLQAARTMSSNAMDIALATTTSTESARQTVTPNSIRAAMTVIAVVPILFVYPFLQRYFVQGLTLGGVKG
ncbi:carbohydrate ABC transporter permease [Mahella australiensis]|uniref:Carbohydrate ABC transporter membrane protein 2, CUT1 family n=1 Tax=Mahella australiensis (strain DSM 15567 / CIP 107919 / 50-1 BON) TaxID=697281 RepID=F4A2J8_MAHA5|nr:carbohydrate ABC transporter permease [Mahella australiensis]AEE97264.1 carbohydrate ABC transporter membrane protein 2, CUT1 family [Mahella australiensis 50-1 BON]